MSGEWHEAARAMKAANPGRSNASIARELGVTTTRVWRVLNPEKYRESMRATNARRGPAKRAWEREMRAVCTACGGACGQGTGRADGTSRLVGGVCASCRTAAHVERVLEMWRLRRDEGLLNTEIAARLEIPVASVATDMCRLRALGYDVPVAPYKNQTAGTASHVDGSTRGLGRALRARGILPTRQP